jgi:sugar transferase (PEP-CTERM/EpsH1 system associated)
VREKIFPVIPPGHLKKVSARPAQIYRIGIKSIPRTTQSFEKYKESTPALFLLSGRANERGRFAMNVLFLCPRWPFPIRKGDQVIAFHRLKEMSKRHSITLVAFSSSLPSQEDIEAVAPYCEAMHLIRTRPFERAAHLIRGVFTRKKPLQVTAYDTADGAGLLRQLCSSGHFDVIHAFLLRVAPFVTAYSDKVVLELIDSMQLNFERQVAADLPLWRRMLAREETHRLKGYEPDLAAKFRNITVVAERDRESLGIEGVQVIPNGVELSQLENTERDPDRVIFTGNMSYHANVEAASWFVQEVWPHVLRSRPSAKFHIVGVNPAKEVRTLAEYNGVVVAGEVPNMRDELCKATVAVAPMRSGSGIQNKILEAMSCRLPVVGTSEALLGLPVATKDALSCADEPEAFAREVLRFLALPEAAYAAGVRGSVAVREHHSWESAAWRVEALYAKAARRQVPSPM